MAKEYKKLNKVEEYDREAAAELAEALTEVNQLQERATQLKELIFENKELHPFVWNTADGQVIALHNLDTDHLANIMQHLLDTGRPISKQIKAEARNRDLPIPTKAAHLFSDRRQMLIDAMAEQDSGGF